MDFITYIIDFILHIDQHLVEIINNFGIWTYIILFLIVFIETGLVVFPFLPGDSLLFAAGALSVLDGSILHIVPLIITLWLAAVLGDTVNYHIGKKIGTSIPEDSWFGKLINKEKWKKRRLSSINMVGKQFLLLDSCLLFVRSRHL